MRRTSHFFPSEIKEETKETKSHVSLLVLTLAPPLFFFSRLARLLALQLMSSPCCCWHELVPPICHSGHVNLPVCVLVTGECDKLPCMLRGPELCMQQTAFCGCSSDPLPQHTQLSVADCDQALSQGWQQRHGPKANTHS